jgi:hypothetical protein
MDLGQQIVILLSVFLVIWYLVFSILNRRRGIGMYHWLREGLEKLGKISEAGWIGSSGSGARLIVGKSQAPFKRIEVVFLLQTREVLPLWIFNILRGKHDALILKAALKNKPAQELEVAREGERDFKNLLVEEQRRPYEQVEAPKGFVMALRGDADDSIIQCVRDFINQYPESVQQISLQRSKPHLILQTNLPEIQEAPAEQFFSALKKCFET